MPDDLNTKLLAAVLSGTGSRTINTNPGGGSILVPQQMQHLSTSIPVLNSSRGGGATWVDGIANFTDKLANALLVRQAVDDAKAEQRSSAEIGAAGLQMMRGRPAETRTYADPNGGDPTTINWNEQKPNVAAGLDYMMASPTLAPKALAMALALQEGQAKAQTEKDVSAFKEGFRYDPSSGGVSILSGGWGDPGYQGRMSYAKSSGEAAGKFPYSTAEDTHKAQLEVWKGNEQPFTLNPGDARFAGPGNSAPTAPNPLMMGASPAPFGAPATGGAPAGGTQTVPKPAGGMTAAPLRPAIARAALESGVDPVMALTAAHIESGMGTAPDRKGSQYQGVFQMGDDRWREAGGAPEARGDQGAQVNVGVKSLGMTRDQLAQKLGRQPEPWEVYLAHQQGVTGAAALLGANPDASAVEVLKPFYEGGKNLQAIVGNTPGSPDANITAGGFTGLWRDRFNNVAARYGAFTPQQAAQGAAPSPAAQQDMAAGLADPMRGMPPGSAAVPDTSVGQPQQATAPATPQRVQVAQAATGSMTDAAPIGIPTAQPNAPRMVAQGGPRPNASFDKLKADTVGNWQAGAEQGATTLNLINQMQDVLDRGFKPGAGAQNMATAARVMQGLGVPADIVSSFYNPADAKAFENASNQMVLSIVKGLGPNPSNADRDFIERTVPLLRDTPEAIREVMGRIRERAAGNVAKFRLGYEHSKAGGDPLEFDTQWNTRQTKSLDGQTYYKIGGKWYAAGN